MKSTRIDQVRNWCCRQSATTRELLRATVKADSAGPIPSWSVHPSRLMGVDRSGKFEDSVDSLPKRKD